MDDDFPKMGPSCAKFWALYEPGNLTLGQIAKRMGLARGSMSGLLLRAKAHRDGRVKPNNGRPAKQFAFEERAPVRCGCGLMLPHECLPTIYQIAGSRSGDSSGLT
jgi:hypothetical protein